MVNVLDRDAVDGVKDRVGLESRGLALFCSFSENKIV